METMMMNDDDDGDHDASIPAVLPVDGLLHCTLLCQ